MNHRKLIKDIFEIAAYREGLSYFFDDYCNYDKDSEKYKYLKKIADEVISESGEHDNPVTSISGNGISIEFGT